MLILNMKPKNATINIDTITNFIEANPSTTPFTRQLESEVKKSPKQAKKLIKLMSSTGTMFAAILFTAPTVAKNGIDIDPEIKHMFTMALIIVAAIGIIASMIAAMLAGIWKMFPFFGGKQADQWNLDIVKGITQVLAAPIIIGAIILLFGYLFGNFPLFQPIKTAVGIFLQK